MAISTQPWQSKDEFTRPKYQVYMSETGEEIVTITHVVHTIRMGDVEDPDLMIAQPIWEWQQTDAGKPPKGWTTDRFTNYGSTFVYGSKPYDCWNLIVFRAPVPDAPQETPQGVDQNVSRKLYNDYANNIQKILTQKDIYNNGSPLLADFKSTWDDDEQGAVTRIKNIFGQESTNSSWYNKLPITSLSPEHQILFKEQLSAMYNSILSSDNLYSFYLPSIKDPKILGKDATPREFSYVTLSTDF